MQHLAQAALAVLAENRPLPRPQAGWTIPVALVLLLLAAFWVVRKLVALALLAAVVAGLFLAYQAGAFDKYVDRGKAVIQQQRG